MTPATIALLLAGLLAGCTPTYEDYGKDFERVFQGYLTGDVQTAKAALIAEEKNISDHEARGSRGVDFAMARKSVYLRLCSISAYMGQTNEAKTYLKRFVDLSGQTNVTLQDLIAIHERSDQEVRPRWRQQQ